MEKESVKQNWMRISSNQSFFIRIICLVNFLPTFFWLNVINEESIVFSLYTNFLYIQITIYVSYSWLDDWKLKI